MGVHRFVLTGAPGSGKTAILEALGEAVFSVPEPARLVLADERSTGGTGTPEQDPAAFVQLLLERAIEDHRTAGRREGSVLFDRGVPDCIAYARYLGVDPAAAVEAANRFRYQHEVLLLNPWEEIYSTDQERTMSFADTEAFHAELVDAYLSTRYELISVPRDTVERRATFVRQRLGS